MKSPAEVRAILKLLRQQHPGAETELHWKTPYQLLVATILSAQTTDQRVNQVTPAVFERYPDAGSLAGGEAGELERLIQATGFFRQKARALLGMATGLVDEHGGNVPSSMDALVRLPGVGRKTANVVLGHALGVPGLAVDRHVLRVANRIGVAASDDPEVVEEQLTKALPRRDWTVASDTFILHGRRVCKPKPLCERCVVRARCDFFQRGEATRVRSAAPGRTAGRAVSRRRAGSAGRAPRRQRGPR